VRRASVEQGLQVMLRAGLIDMRASDDGIRYEAGDEAHSFVSALASSYITELRSRSQWVVEQFGALSEAAIRQQTRTIFGSWSDETHDHGRGQGGGSWTV
jgi:hypothetical protein